MNQENPTRLEPNNQILPAAIECLHALADELGGDLPGIEGPGEARIFDLSPADKIFNSFFEIKTLDNFPQAYNYGQPVFRGIYEDNDPRKRLMMIINYNTDVSDFWEFSATGFRPIEESNEAYKLGVNYMMYGLLH